MVYLFNGCKKIKEILCGNMKWFVKVFKLKKVRYRIMCILLFL